MEIKTEIVIPKEEDARRVGKPVVGFTCGSFDLLHAVHVLMLEEARSVCDRLIVGLQTDPTIDRPDKNEPVESLLERQVQLKGCRFVDDIYVYDTEKDLEQLLTMLPIDVRILSEEYKDKDYTGKQLCKDLGIEIYFNRRRHGFSSSELRDRL